ncbi:unnamed protein product, partial [Meganyctiphanes norvegica]
IVAAAAHAASKPPHSQESKFRTRDGPGDGDKDTVIRVDRNVHIITPHHKHPHHRRRGGGQRARDQAAWYDEERPEMKYRGRGLSRDDYGMEPEYIDLPAEVFYEPYMCISLGKSCGPSNIGVCKETKCNYGENRIDDPFCSGSTCNCCVPEITELMTLSAQDLPATAVYLR